MRKLLLASLAALGASWGAADLAQAQPLPTSPAPTPGNVVVRLNGTFRFYAGVAAQSDFNTPAGKTDSQGFLGYARLYPGFDGLTANGIKYGVALEIRQDTGGPTTAGPSGQAGGPLVSGTTSYPGHGSMYFRRAWGYLGTDQLGTIRVGSGNGASTQLITGTFENYNDGAWNGDLPGIFVGNAQLTWPFADVGNMYTTEKVVYLSPRIAGFDFGVSYEPSTHALSGGSNCSAGGAGCAALASTSVTSELARRRNTFEGALRYTGSFGPLGLVAEGGYVGSSKVSYNGTTPLAAASTYDGLQVGSGGAVVSIAGVSVGGYYQRGRFNGQWALDPKGAPDGEAWTAGATYTMGPVIIGASWIDYKSAGDYAALVGTGSQRREIGAAAGATYSLAPGMAIFLSYLWDERKQGGYNFVTGEDTGTGARLHNSVHAQAISIGTGFTW